MKGIADLLDSEMEDSHNFLDENSILSSPSNIGSHAASSVKTSQSKKTKKRHRVTMPKPKSRVTKSSPARTTKTAAKKPAAAAKRKALEEQVNGQATNGSKPDEEGVKEIQESQEPKKRGRPTTKAKARKPTVSVEVASDDEEMEVDQTPLVARSSHAPTRVKAAPKVVSKGSAAIAAKPTKTASRTIVEPQQERLEESDADDMDAAVERPTYTDPSRASSKPRREPAFRRRAGSASDTERGDPNLRRKLGDVTRKFENVDLKYRTLKDVGIHEANANMEKLRKQCDATTQASSDLIASLKNELAMQAPLALEARKLKKQMQTQEVEAAQLRSTSAELTTSLATAQNEIRALQAKLSAARSSSVAAESSTARAPSSAIKTAGPARSTAVSNGEAAQAAQVAQMKEELYSDLTGLIVRSVKRNEDGDTYDCIQTGRNGTLHFKLFVDSEEAKSTSFEETDFLYTPLLDPNRDRDMIELMPTYLTEEITFARQNAAKFYGRVLDTLTRRRSDE